MKFGEILIDKSVEHPKVVVGIVAFITLTLALTALLPTLMPETFPALNALKVDTDPENMLSADEPVRIFHDEMKEEMGLYDMVVLGVVNDHHPDGVFNPETLKRVYELTEFAKTLRWERDGETVGVREVDIIAPSTVDNIEQADLGAVNFEWLMPTPPTTREESLAVRDKALRIPFLNGTLVSEDGKALCVYLPLTSKDLSYRVYSRLMEKIKTLSGTEEYHITGLPVAEDTFGVEMFKQMAMSAPLAMLIIFLLMFFFFRKLSLIVSPMILAIVCVICTMGLLVVTGNTVHIMSSMIPIFIMPIAVLDSIHILSEFFDRYQETRDRGQTIRRVMRSLFAPMLYTSLTSAAGFGSLALTPIPPVQVFGMFVAIGIMLAWIWTITFIPAFVMLLPQKSLENFGAVHQPDEDVDDMSHLKGFERFMRTVLRNTGRFTFKNAKLVLALAVLCLIVAGYGISQIQINDNPIRWFSFSHPIRVADRVLNSHFGGTYMAYLALEASEDDSSFTEYVEDLDSRLRAQGRELELEYPGTQEIFRVVREKLSMRAANVQNIEELLKTLTADVNSQLDAAPYELYDAWDQASLFLDTEKQRDEVFKQPEALAYIAQIQQALLETGIVGKSNSLTDIVKTVYRELLSGKDEDFRIPETSNGVAQCLITYQNSHRNQDLWHFVTPDHKKTVLWIQTTSGDNKDMTQVVKVLDRFIEANPAPFGLQHHWFGLTYINIIWQERMVSGMLQSFFGSFFIVLLMMIFMFQSALWGLLSMIPLTITIALIYGFIGLVGKDYDMPVAVLSSLSLGLAVDYSIHFLARAQQSHEKYGRWDKCIGPMFGEPARAITRNVIAVGVGFLPLLAAPLVPYKTVGFFIASILLAAGAASILILPALITVMERLVFPETQRVVFLCHCGTRLLIGILLIGTIVLNVHQFMTVGWTQLTWYSGIGIIALVATCMVTTRLRKCGVATPSEQPEGK